MNLNEINKMYQIKPIRSSLTKNRWIIAVNDDGTEQGRYLSVKEAAEGTGARTEDLHRVVNKSGKRGGRLKAKGFIFNTGDVIKDEEKGDKPLRKLLYRNLDTGSERIFLNADEASKALNVSKNAIQNVIFADKKNPLRTRKTNLHFEYIEG